MTISVLYIVQFHAGKKRRAAQWKLCCGILIKLESLKRGKRKSLQWAIFKAKHLKRIRTGRYSKWTEIHQSPPKHAFEGWGGGGDYGARSFSFWTPLKFRHERCLLFAPNWSKSWRFSSSCGQYHPRGFLILLRALPACPRRSLERKQKVCEQEIRKRKRPILSCWKYCKTQDNILLNNAAAASSSTAVQFFRFSFVCRIFFFWNPPPLISLTSKVNNGWREVSRLSSGIDWEGDDRKRKINIDFF